MHPESSSSGAGLSRILTRIRDARRRLHRQHPIPADTVTPSPSAPLKAPLTAPEDITAQLTDDVGLEFASARKVSQTFVDKAVEFQFHSKNRLTNHYSVAAQAARSSKLVSSPDAFQSQLVETHQSFYKRDLSSLRKWTIDLARTLRKTPPPDVEQSEEPEMSASRPTPSEQDGDEDPEESVTADAADDKALSEMGMRASVLLTRMYEKGFTFPRRHEKIKLSEATGLTYRQVNIWFSNRRERKNQSTRRRADGAGSGRASRSVTREPSDQPPSSRRKKGKSTATTSPTSTLRDGTASNPISLEEDVPPSPTRTEIEPTLEDDIFGTDDEGDRSSTAAGQNSSPEGTHVPSLTASLVTLGSVDGPSPSLDIPNPESCGSAPWMYNNPAHFVNLPRDACDPSLFDFSAANLSMPVGDAPTSLPPVAPEPQCDPNFSAAPINTAPITSAAAPPAPSAEYLAGFIAGLSNSNSMLIAAAAGWGVPPGLPPPPPMNNDMFDMPQYDSSSQPQIPMTMPAQNYPPPPPFGPTSSSDTVPALEAPPLLHAPPPPQHLPSNKRARVDHGREPSQPPPFVRHHTRPTPSRKVAVPGASKKGFGPNNPTSLPHKTPALAHATQAPMPPRSGPNGERAAKAMPKRRAGPAFAVNPHAPVHMTPQPLPIVQQ